jgi:tetratricopeptide (TPR) repeat protein
MDRQQEIWRNLNEAARVAFNQEDMGKAVRILMDAIERSQYIEYEDIHLSDIYGNLARLLYDDGRYEEALPLNEKALAILERVRGRQHPDTARCLTRVADCHSMQGDDITALPLYRRALAIFERHYDENHNDVQSSRDDVRMALTNLGNEAWAEFLAQSKAQTSDY